jgi:aspartate dehydrogenase
MGSRVLAALRQRLLPKALYAVLDPAQARVAIPALAGVAVFASAEELYAWAPGLAVECAGHSAVATVVPELLGRGCDVIVVSIGALVDDALRAQLRQSVARGGSRLSTVSGAVGGLDALEAARSAGLTSVTYTGRKPPAAWQGTPAEGRFDLASLTEPTVLFSGSARGAASTYPQNANVTAAIALAGVGFDATIVQLVADPSIERNIHELVAEGAFGRLVVRLENAPLPDNPKTSWLAVLSIERELRRVLELADPQ